MIEKLTVKKEFVETCDRCHGTGYKPEFSHVYGGVCFKCNGSGWVLNKAGEQAQKKIENERKKEALKTKIAAKIREEFEDAFGLFLSATDLESLIQHNIEVRVNRI